MKSKTLVLNPEIFQGHARRPPYFEGWYYKFVSADETDRWAVIPGIFRSPDAEREHCFVQILNGSTGEAAYHRYPAESFLASRENFDVRVGPNRFTGTRVVLDIPDGDIPVSGEVALGPRSPWPVTLRSPGVMGPYAWLPRMECNHGVLSFDHALEGSLRASGRQFSLTGGRGYLEKDWGAAFPEGYVWMQSNHFPGGSSSFFASIAVIPWLRGAFPGFIAGFLHDGRLYRFTTYTRARSTQLEVSDSDVVWTITNRRFELSIRAERASAGLLLGPTREDMGSRVGETMQAVLHLRLRDRGDQTILFEGTGRNAGLEVHGNLEKLTSLTKQEAFHA